MYVKDFFEIYYFSMIDFDSHWNNVTLLLRKKLLVDLERAFKIYYKNEVQIKRIKIGNAMVCDLKRPVEKVWFI